ATLVDRGDDVYPQCEHLLSGPGPSCWVELFSCAAHGRWHSGIHWRRRGSLRSMATVRADDERIWVPTTFLSINSRPVFLPVPVWANRLSEQLATLGDGDAAKDRGALSECF